MNIVNQIADELHLGYYECDKSKNKFIGNSKNIFVLSDTYVKEAKTLPLIKTKKILEQIDLSSFEALIFTSKKAIHYINNINNDWKTKPIYAISTQTAKEVQALGGSLRFVGKEKHGSEFAQELVPLLKGQKVAFIGAKNIVSNLVSILNQNNVQCEHIAIYETVCLEYQEKLDLPDDSIFIFSSPSTVDCFFKNVNWKESFKVISIGKTTAKFIPNTINFEIAETTSLQSCVEKALSL